MRKIDACHSLWKIQLAEFIQDASASTLHEGVVIQAMMHCAITESARLNGAVATARELYLLSLKFFQAAEIDKRANAQSSTLKQ